ncbi:hypothetical protein C2R22_15620 [Salinigranum rubrum]|uniref:HNH nuclease domain-containing protein n=1 Tax=Salinigranum rubrum TaxID=755307 RepID=A0A2I8VP48_9EURY|nr:hypothetical protein C2R22_15620 [Salinigranum rubrum]
MELGDSQRWLTELRNRHAALLKQRREVRFRPSCGCNNQKRQDNDHGSARHRRDGGETGYDFGGERDWIENELVGVYTEYVGRACDPDETYQAQIKKLLLVFEYSIPSRILAEVVGCSAGHARRFEWDAEQQIVREKQWSRKQREHQAPPALAKRVRERDDDRCVRCESTEQTVVHHIDPARQDGPAVMENLAVLCNRCHVIAHGGAVNTGEVIHGSTRQFWAWAEPDARWSALNNEQTTFDVFR